MAPILDVPNPGAGGPAGEDLKEPIRRFLSTQGEGSVVSACLFGISVRNLGRLEGEDFSPELTAELSQLPGFRDILIDEHVGLDCDLVLRPLGRLDPIERVVHTMAARIEGGEHPPQAP